VNKEGLFILWGKVLKGDKKAKAEFLKLPLVTLPHQKDLHTSGPSKRDLHIMYIQLYKTFKR
jgi:hypothetical protein